MCLFLPPRYAARWAELFAPLAKAALASSDNKYAQLASKGIGALGFGMSAGNHGIEKRIKK